MDSLVARLVTTGIVSSVFTYFFIRLAVTPRLSKDDPKSAWRKNLASLITAVIFALGLTFLLTATISPAIVVEAIFTGIIAASVATYGHEAVKNFGNRSVLNVGGDLHSGDNVTLEAVGDDLEAVSIGRGSSATIDKDD